MRVTYRAILHTYRHQYGLFRTFRESRVPGSRLPLIPVVAATRNSHVRPSFF